MCAAKTKPTTGLLMPKATAVWLVENTALTFEQIAEFTSLASLEVQALADGDVGRGIQGRDPVRNNEVLQEELDKAEADSTYIMKLATNDLPTAQKRSKGPKYTPVSKRGDKPDAISYLLKHHPEITDAQITKLVGTTKPTINNIRDRTHTNIASVKPRHPVDLGLCTYAELEAASRKGLKAQGKNPDEIQAHKEKLLADQEQAVPAPQEETTAEFDAANFDFSNFMKTSSSSSSGSES